MNTGRVIKENRTNYIVSAGGQEITAVLRGQFHDTGEFPKVGDYVEYTAPTEHEAVIESILPRKSVIERKSVADDRPQVIVVNVDLIFVVMGLDHDFNLNRLERYMLLAQQSGIEPVVVLNKRDLVSDVTAYTDQITERFPDARIEVVSAMAEDNMESLASYVTEGVTAVLLGSSGAGKSTITNWLLKSGVQETKDVREDDSHGRHTTTSRELFTLPSGGFLIDTPGMRELGLVGDVVGDVFKRIAVLAHQCKFNDCDHERSAGCAVQAAIEKGELTHQQLENYVKLQREKDYLDSKSDEEGEWRRRRGARKIHKQRSKIKQRKYMERGFED